MTKAFPPRRPLVGGWLALALALGLVATAGLPARAQGDGKAAQKPGSDKKSDAKAGKAKDDDTKDDEDAKDDEEERRSSENEAPDRYEDPNAAAALENKFKELPAANGTAADKTLVDQLARGQGQMDLNAINRFVRDRASALTRQRDIAALMDPNAKGGNPKGLEQAARDLMGPLLVPPSNANSGFRKAYVARLIDAFGPIWKGHLHSRTMAAIVLSVSGEPEALKTFADLLEDPEQLVIVKLRAAVGIANVAREARRRGSALPDTTAILPGKALADFLRREPNAFWPAQARALEALGMLRQATEKPFQGRAEFAEAALTLLADPKAAPAVRAWAGWALGMMVIPNSVKGYNLPLVAHAMGEAASDIGQRIAELPSTDKVKAVQLANDLVQLHMGLVGDPEIRAPASGLLRSNLSAAGAAQPYMTEVERRVRAVGRAALEVSNSTKTQWKANQKALMTEVEGLRQVLSKPLSTGRALYTGAAPLAASSAGEAAAKGADGDNR